MASINEALENHKLYRLLKRIAEGDEQAVDTLYSDYGDFIYFHILNITAARVKIVQVKMREFPINNR